MVARTIAICQNRTCRKSGAAKVLQAFQRQVPAEVSVEARGCLGQCGNGPMVVVLPDEVWYWRIHPDEVRAIVERHLKGNQPVKALLYPPIHS